MSGEYVFRRNCPNCGHYVSDTIGARVEHHDEHGTYAIQECRRCGELWGEPREFYGILSETGDDE